MPGWVGWGGGEGIGYQGVGGPVLDPVLELEFELEFEFPDPANRLSISNIRFRDRESARQRISRSTISGEEMEKSVPIVDSNYVTRLDS